MNERFAEMEKRCEDIVATLKKTTADPQEKFTLADSEKFKVMENATPSEMQ